MALGSQLALVFAHLSQIPLLKNNYTSLMCNVATYLNISAQQSKMFCSVFVVANMAGSVVAFFVACGNFGCTFG